RREDELSLLKDVILRFHRHNIRNELNIVKGYAQTLNDEINGYDQEFENIIDTSERVIQTSEKARMIEKVLELSDERGEIELTCHVESVVQDLKVEYPDIEFEVETPREAEAYATNHIKTAIRNLVENAAEHNSSDEPRVVVSIGEIGDEIELKISDNGPGIPDHEIDVLREKEETPLQHASGLGLWLVNWITEKSGGELDFDIDESGTTVTVILEKVSFEPEPESEETVAVTGQSED
ncbi:MAG: HAMP domain-containing sensor histidine kinase, partial [Halobacteria archaeon]|nr:HAMP domain-containing sensor histidine kinase [Halobacteria archaeon]